MRLAYIWPYGVFNDIQWQKDVGGLSLGFWKLGFKVYMIVYKFDSRIKYPQIVIFETNKIISKNIFGNKNISGYRRIMILAKSIVNIIFRKHIDVVIVQHLKSISILIALLIKLHCMYHFFKHHHNMNRITAIVKLDWNPDILMWYRGFTKYIKLIIYLLLSVLLFDYIIVESTCSYKSLTKLLPIISILRHKIVVIPNGYAEDFLGKCPEDKKYKDRIILCISRITYEKGLDILIRAFAKIAQNHPETKLRIIGAVEDNRYYNIIRHMIERLNLKNKIEFLNNLSVEDLTKEYCRASLFVLPSRSEGAPISRIEALAFGLPVITTTAGCGKDYEKYGAIIIPINNVDNLVNALEKVLSKITNNISANISHMVKPSVPSWKKVALMINYFCIRNSVNRLTKK